MRKPIDYYNQITKNNLLEDYHYNKATAATENHIKLLQFFEDEINWKNDICRSIIRTHLNMNQRIYGRDFSILEITGKDATRFCTNFRRW